MYSYTFWTQAYMTHYLMAGELLVLGRREGTEMRRFQKGLSTTLCFIVLNACYTSIWVGLPKGKKKGPGKEITKIVVKDNPFQYSCLENPMNRGGWRAIVHTVANSRTWLKTHTHSVINTWVCSVSYFWEFTFPALGSMESFNSFFSASFNLILFFKLLYKLCI